MEYNNNSLNNQDDQKKLCIVISNNLSAQLMKNRQSDPLTQYSDKEPMTPAKLNAGEPTAVKRDPNDQQITSEGQTGTNTE